MLGSPMPETIETLRAENAQLRELLNVYNLGGWMDSLSLIKERDALRARLDQYKKCTYPDCRCNQPDDCAWME